MTEELQHLWALHLLDDEAAKLRAELAKIPEEKRAAQAERAEAQQAVDANRAQAADAQKRRRDLERQAEALSGEEKKFQGQLPQVKKNEEYQALLHEIEGVKARRSDLETQVLECLETEEALEAARPGLEKALAAADAGVRERVAAIDTRVGAASERLETLEARRAQELAPLTPPTRSRYDRIHQSRQGTAVVAIDKSACGGCFRALPPQVMQEARKRDRLLTCEGCGRLVIYPPDAS